MNKVKAWAVKDHEGYLWVKFISKSKGAVINSVCRFASKDWEKLISDGFEIVPVEITEITND